MSNTDEDNISSRGLLADWDELMATRLQRQGSGELPPDLADALQQTAIAHQPGSAPPASPRQVRRVVQLFGEHTGRALEMLAGTQAQLPVPQAAADNQAKTLSPRQWLSLVGAVVLAGLAIYIPLVMRHTPWPLINWLPLAMVVGVPISLLFVAGPARHTHWSAGKVHVGERADTAVIVVHGIGQQERYETLDGLTAGFDALSSDTSADVGVRGGFLETQARPHLVAVAPTAGASLADTTGAQGWFELSLLPGLRQVRPADFYEAYWAPLAQRTRTLPDVLRWLGRSALGLAAKASTMDGNQAVAADGRSTQQKRQETRQKTRVELLQMGGTLVLVLLVSALLLNVFLGAVRSVARDVESPPVVDARGVTANSYAPLVQADALLDAYPTFARQADTPAFADYVVGVARTPLQAPLVSFLVSTEQRVVLLKQTHLLIKIIPWAAWALMLVGLYALWQVLQALGALRQSLGHKRRNLRNVRGAAEHARARADAELTRHWLRFLFWTGSVSLVAEGIWLATDAALASMFYFMLLVVLANGLRSALKGIVVDYLGDIPTYVVTSENSDAFAAHEAIKDRVRAVILSICAEADYRRVIVVAHSLGTVVARDVLLDLHKERERLPAGPEQQQAAAALAKITSYLTIGSPLRKVRTMLEEHKGHGRALTALVHKPDLELWAPAGGTVQPGHPRWLNYWIMTDIVANPLADMFPVREEQRVQGTKGALWTHSDYWHNPQFLRAIALEIWALPQELLAETPATGGSPLTAAAAGD